jgi:group I intron endonuclease
MKGFIYGLICPISGKIKYIGLTKKDPIKRLSAHITETKYYIKKGLFLNRKHTWIKKLINLEICDKIKIEILEECEFDILAEKEIFWINEYKKFDITNSTDGGDGVFNLSDDARKRISNANSGEKNGMYGKRMNRTKEQKEKLSQSLKDSQKLKDSRNSKEYKEKISNVTSIPILVLDENREIVFEFKNCRECAEYFNCTKGNIANAIRFNRQIGKGKSYKYWVIKKES